MKVLRANIRRTRLRRQHQLACVRTEDNIPVCNISFDKLSKNIRKPLIQKHFAKFGPIKHVKIMYGRTRSQLKKCIVYFKTPIAATAALKKSLHTLNYEVVHVMPCPSWEQPLQTNFTDDDDDTDLPTINALESTILDLNDYCLEMIYKIIDLRQQIRLSLCHVRLENVFARMICPRVIKHFSFEQIRGFTLWEIRQLFKTAGQFMHSFEIERIDCAATMKHELSIYDFMRDYCAHVQRLQIIRRRFIFTNFLNVLSVNHITELELYECDLYDGEISHLRSLRNLQTLGLACNPNILGFRLRLLKKVQKLSLYGCQKVSQENLIDICKSLNLRYLDVRCLDSIRNWSAIVEHCNSLETLKLSRIDCNGHKGVESIAKLPNLRRLEMQFYVRAMPSNFYDTLAEYHADNLEELKITGNIYALFPTVTASIIKFKRLSVLWLGDNEYNSSKDFLKMLSSLKDLQEINLNYSIRIKGDHLLPLLKACTKLKRISLRHCRHITNDFVFKAIAILDKRSEERSAPLLILVGGTRIRRYILKDTRYLNAKHLLRLSFHMRISELGYIEEKNEFLLNDNALDDVESIDEEDDFDSDDSDDYMNSFWGSDDDDDNSGDELDILFWL